MVIEISTWNLRNGYIWCIFVRSSYTKIVIKGMTRAEMILNVYESIVHITHRLDLIVLRYYGSTQLKLDSSPIRLLNWICNYNCHTLKPITNNLYVSMYWIPIFRYNWKFNETQTVNSLCEPSQKSPPMPSGVISTFSWGSIFFYIFQGHRTIEKLEKTALYM